MSFDAIVLAGGDARRLGGVDKPMLDVDGVPMLARVLDAVAGARVRVVVGPRRALDPDVVWCREQPPGGGPVAGLAAGLARTAAPTVVVLAADLPWIGPAVAPLLAALDEPDPHDLAVLRAGERRNYLAATWRRSTLVAALAGLDSEGAAVRALVAAAQDAGARVADVPDRGWGDDCDTWADLARARARSIDGSP